MEGTKLRFSEEESRLATDPAWILTKNSVMEKVVGMMARLSEAYRELWAAGGCDVGVALGSPKISRGENYRGLPWVMLDYPRVFGKEDVMAIRTMFWWGHAFLVTLHLKGRYRRLFVPVLERHWTELAAAGFHVGVSEDEWRHEHADETYRPMSGGGDLATGLDFLKLSAALPVGRWPAAADVLREWFALLANALASYCPGDGTGL